MMIFILTFEPTPHIAAARKQAAPSPNRFVFIMCVMYGRRGQHPVWRANFQMLKLSQIAVTVDLFTCLSVN